MAEEQERDPAIGYNETQRTLETCSAKLAARRTSIPVDLVAAFLAATSKGRYHNAIAVDRIAGRRAENAPALPTNGAAGSGTVAGPIPQIAITSASGHGSGKSSGLSLGVSHTTLPTTLPNNQQQDRLSGPRRLAGPIVWAWCRLSGAAVGSCAGRAGWIRC